MSFQVKISINGAALQTVPLTFWNEVAAQRRYRGIAALSDGSCPLLFDLDEWDSYYSLRVLNAFDTELAGNCSLWFELEGQNPIDIPELR